jgi:hypothetical protein
MVDGPPSAVHPLAGSRVRARGATSPGLREHVTDDLVLVQVAHGHL